MRRGLVLLLLILLCGCSRQWYRLSADKETYGIIDERKDPAVWPIANDSIEAPPTSRLHDPYNPDNPPMPPDDPAADKYLVRVDGMKNSKHFHDDGDAPYIEDPEWKQSLQLDKDGQLVLTPDKAVELGVLHSRDYQAALDQLYLAALALSLNRFNFACQWYGTNNSTFDFFGSSDTNVNTITTTSELGFTRNLAAGGQFIANLANSFVFAYNNGQVTTSVSTLTATFMQPLLAGFGRRIALEPLTEGERTVLYGVRTFARFRKTFYFNLTTAASGGYMSLLLQVQNLRDLEANLHSQEENLRLNEALLKAGAVSIVQVDQAFQSVLQAKLSILQAQVNLDSGLDQYKLTLGLPPNQPVRLDDGLLKPFELNDPELLKLQGELDTFFAEYREMNTAPFGAKLRDGYVRLKTYHARLVKLVAVVEEELRRWKPNVGKAAEDQEQAKRERATFDNLGRQLPELSNEVTRLGATLDKVAQDLDENPGKLHREQLELAASVAGGIALAIDSTRKLDWERLQRNARQEIAAAAELFVLQNQIRVYLIELKPIPATLAEASAYARDNRLDLMNERATVVDTWRQVAVTADALRAGLNVTAKAAIATPPTSNNPVAFRASASDYNVAFEFNSPLNRMMQRNAYRTAQINYQAERRNFMLLDDQLQAAIRQDVRTLETQRASFAIARQSLISAARQVEASRDRLLLADKAADTTITQDVLTALNSLLQAKETLISSWISYETTRIQLLLDMEALQVDDRGIAIDEHDKQSTDTLPPPTRVPDGDPDARPAP